MAYEKDCILCGEAITNPISPQRLMEQVVYWALEKKPSLVPIVRDITECFMAFSHENTTCVITKENTNVCPHCYCKEVFSWLLENGHENLAEEFMQRFNFELYTSFPAIYQSENRITEEKRMEEFVETVKSQQIRGIS